MQNLKFPLLPGCEGKQKQNGSRRDKEIDNESGWEMLSNAKDYMGPPKALPGQLVLPEDQTQSPSSEKERQATVWADSLEKVGHAGADQSTRPVTDVLHHPGATGFLALRHVAPVLWFARPMEPSWQTFAGTRLLLTAQNRQETNPSLHRTWGGVPSVGASAEKKIEQLGRGGSETASWSWNEGRERRAHTEHSTGVRSGAERVQSTWLPLQPMG